MFKIAIDYKWTFYRYPKETHREYQQQANACHQRSAEAILKLCEHNRGLYIKVGQYISSMNHVLPPEYTATLKVLQDRAPTVSFDTVQQVFREDFGKDLSEVYSEFNPIPLASASLAQVHKAHLRTTGEEVAVKIQYPTLRGEFNLDMLAHKLILVAGEFIFKDFQLTWMQDEIEENLRHELSFLHEAANSKRAAENFKRSRNKDKYQRIHIPIVFDQYTSERVMTMEFIDGCKMNNKDAMQQKGVGLKDAVQTFLEAMSETIFLHGFVHCDPHIGNVLIRRTPSSNNNNWQLVLLDFGLCRELRPHVRVGYCQLWEALVLARDDDVKKYAKQLGVDEYELLAVSVLMRPYSGSAAAGMSKLVSRKEYDATRKKFESKIPQALETFQKMPRELLLVLRNQNYLRSINHELGYLVNRFRIMAACAVRGIGWRNVGDESDIRRIKRKSSQWQWLPETNTEDDELEELGIGVRDGNGELKRKKGVSKAVRLLWAQFLSSISSSVRSLEFELALVYSDALLWVATQYLQWFRSDVLKQIQEESRRGGQEVPLIGG